MNMKWNELTWTEFITKCVQTKWFENEMNSKQNEFKTKYLEKKWTQNGINLKQIEFKWKWNGNEIIAKWNELQMTINLKCYEFKTNWILNKSV